MRILRPRGPLAIADDRRSGPPLAQPFAGDPRHRLGRGRAALLGDVAEDTAAVDRRGQRKTPIEFIRPNPRNPRKNFDNDDLDELAGSIKERGVIQPVLVRAIPQLADAYEI